MSRSRSVFASEISRSTEFFTIQGPEGGPAIISERGAQAAAMRALGSAVRQSRYVKVRITAVSRFCDQIGDLEEVVDVGLLGCPCPLLLNVQSGCDPIFHAADLSAATYGR
jgi:hypothetical protein